MVTGELSTYLYKLTKILVVILLSLSSYYLINVGNKYVDETKRINLNMRKVIPWLLALFGLFLVNKLFKNYGILADMFYTIILSVVVAYLLNPLINYLERKGVKSRILAVLLIYLVILGIILIFGLVIIPKTSRELAQFVVSIPGSMNDLYRIFNRFLDKYESLVGNIPFITDNLTKAFKNSVDGFETLLLGGVKSAVNGLMNFLTKAVSLILTPILTFYFLVDKEQFLSSISSLVPKKYEKDSKELYSQIDNSLSQFVRGRLIMAAFVGVSISIVLLILGVDFAIPIGLITGFADIIPYIGPFLGFVPAVVFAFLESPVKALWVSICFLIIQWLENNVIAPKVIGQTTGLHPMVVLLAIVIGGGMFGVIGMIFSVPVIAVLVIVTKFLLEKYKKSKETSKKKKVIDKN